MVCAGNWIRRQLLMEATVDISAADSGGEMTVRRTGGKQALRAASLCVLLLLCRTSLGAELSLEGSLTSYTKFPPWEVSENGSLQFDFRSRFPDGLLLYMDDGGRYDFIEVKLVDGVARLRFNLGSGTCVVTLGQGLDDGAWHSLELRRHDARTTFTLSVRDLVYTEYGGSSERVSLIDSRGLRATDRRECDTANTCRHDGVCVDTVSGSICDCSLTEYVGKQCEIGRNFSFTTANTPLLIIRFFFKIN